MPYRLNPRNKREVQVKRGAKWVTKKVFKTVAKAKAYLTALSINVRH